MRGIFAIGAMMIGTLMQGLSFVEAEDSDASGPVFIAVNDIQALPTNAVPESLFSVYQPSLKFANEYDPYPVAAVDRKGRISKGLDKWNPMNDYHGGAGRQVYVRGGFSGKKYGMVYAWFFTTNAHKSVEKIRKYQWVWAVVWLEGLIPLKYDGVTGLGGGRNPTPEPKGEKRSILVLEWPAEGDDPMVLTDKSETSNYFGFGLDPLVEWDIMPILARKALNRFDFEGRPCPLANGQFQKLLDAALATK